MAELLEHPEFAEGLESQIADAVMRILHADGAVRGYFGRIVPTELEDVIIAAGGELPALAVLIPYTEQRPETNDLTAELTVVVELLMLHQVAEAATNGRWLRQRIVNHLCRLFYGEHPDGYETYGQLHDVDGQPLTEALLTVERVPFAYRFAAGVIATPIQLRFRAWQSLRTGLRA